MVNLIKQASNAFGIMSLAAAQQHRGWNAVEHLYDRPRKSRKKGHRLPSNLDVGDVYGSDRIWHIHRLGRNSVRVYLKKGGLVLSGPIVSAKGRTVSEAATKALMTKIIK